MSRAEKQQIRDQRRHGWFAVYKSANQRIREHFGSDATKLRVPTALAVYSAIIELANDAREMDHFELYRRDLSERAGVNPKAASEYQAELEVAGVIRVERRQVEGVNLPNIIHLIDTDVDGSDRVAEVGASGPDPGSQAPTVGVSGPEGSGPQAPPHEEAATTSPSREQDEEARVARKPVSYRGRRVPEQAVQEAEEILAVFAESSGRAAAARTGRGDPTPALKQVIGAMQARPDVDAEKWKAAVRATAAAPPDWVAGPLQIGHVFGERAAEWALSAADAPQLPVGVTALRPQGGGGRQSNAAKVDDKVRRLRGA